MEKPDVGSRVVRDGKEYEVVSVMARLTPFKKANQFTTVIGYTLGLREVRDEVRCPCCKQVVSGL